MKLKKSWFAMPYTLKEISYDGDCHIRFPEEFAEMFIKEFTKKGDKVFDPFAGFGTTLFAAQKLGRIGVGIEYDEDRCAYIVSKLTKPSRIIKGDSRKLSEYRIPKCDFSITSPPYMRDFDLENPLTNYTKEGSYVQYLRGIRRIYAQMRKIMKKNARIVIEVSNTFEKGRPMTPLAFDIAREVSKEFYFERDYIYCVEEGDLKTEKTNHSYCFMFINK